MSTTKPAVPPALAQAVKEDQDYAALFPENAQGAAVAAYTAGLVTDLRALVDHDPRTADEVYAALFGKDA